MSGRRGFLALVGGSMVTGLVGQGEAKRPTLLLPSRDLVRASELPPAPVGRSLMQETAMGLIYGTAAPPGPVQYPLLAAEQTQMHAFIHVKGGLPEDLFLDWLEGGLRMVEGCKPGGRIRRAMEMDRADGKDPLGAA